MMQEKIHNVLPVFKNHYLTSLVYDEKLKFSQLAYEQLKATGDENSYCMIDEYVLCLNLYGATRIILSCC